MRLKVQKVINGIKIFDENNGFIIISKEQAKSLANVLTVMTK